MAEDAGASRVMLRELIAADQDEFLGLARASVGLHHPWYTLPTTPEAFGARYRGAAGLRAGERGDGWRHHD
jgi:hypothetical protein